MASGTLHPALLGRHAAQAMGRVGMEPLSRRLAHSSYPSLQARLTRCRSTSVDPGLGLALPALLTARDGVPTRPADQPHRGPGLRWAGVHK